MENTQVKAKKIKDEYDYVIVGAGLSGICIATLLSRFTENVLLIDSNDFTGGINHKVNTACGAQNNGLRFIPDTTLSQKAMAFLQNLMQEKIEWNSLEIPPVNYDSGQLKPFVGFGSHPPAFYEELEYFTLVKHLQPSIPVHEWTQKVFAQFKGDSISKSYVTRFAIENDRVDHVVINGTKIIKGTNFIFTGLVKDLSVLLPQEIMGARARQKLSKSTYWNALCIDFCHNHAITESQAIHVLNGTTQDELGPCLGQFQPAQEINGETLQFSQWMTFLDTEECEDTELLGLALKKIKRQIKRAYPDALENLKSERIAVFPQYAGNGELKVNANQSLPQAENLWIASASMNPQKNLVGALLQAELVCNAIGFQTDSQEVQNPSELV